MNRGQTQADSGNLTSNAQPRAEVDQEDGIGAIPNLYRRIYGLFGSGSKFLFNGNPTFIHQSSGGGLDGIKRLYERSSPAAAHNSKERYDPPKCHVNTRTGLLTMSRKWTEKGPRFMWLHASAGAGKSAIAQTFTEELSAASNLAASFFFSRTAPPDSHRSHEERFIATIAYHLAHSIHKLRPYIEHVVLNVPSVFDLTLTEQVIELIIEPLKRLKRDNPDFDVDSAANIIIIDGLDECNGESGQKQVLESLKELVGHQDVFPFAVFLASRPELIIRTWFANLHTKSPEQLQNVHLLDHCDADNDIRIYISAEVDEIHQSHPYKDKLPQGWPFSELIELIVRRACGQFVYATTVMKYVKDPRHYPHRRLSFILDQKIPGSDRPYAELDALYLHVLRSAQHPVHVQRVLSFRIVTISFVGNFRGIGEKFFECVEELLVLPCPLTVLLADLQSVTTGSLESMLFSTDWHSEVTHNRAPSVFDVPTPVAFYHASFLEFLLDKQRAEEFHVDLLQDDEALFQLSRKQSSRLLDNAVEGLHYNRLDVALAFSVMIQTQAAQRPTEFTNIIADLERWGEHDPHLVNHIDYALGTFSLHQYTQYGALQRTSLLGMRLRDVFLSAIPRRRTRCLQELSKAGFPPELFIIYSNQDRFKIPAFWRLDPTTSPRDCRELMAYHLLTRTEPWRTGSAIKSGDDNDSLPCLSLECESTIAYLTPWLNIVPKVEEVLHPKDDTPLPEALQDSWNFREFRLDVSAAMAFYINHITSLFERSEDAAKPLKIAEYLEEHDRLKSGSWRAYVALEMIWEIQWVLWFYTPISDSVVSALEHLSERVTAPCGSLESEVFTRVSHLNHIQVLNRVACFQSSCSLPRFYYRRSDDNPSGNHIRQLGYLHDYVRVYDEYTCRNMDALNRNSGITEDALTMTACRLATVMKGSSAKVHKWSMDIGLENLVHTW